MAKWQIVRREPNRVRWEFIAHGAAFTEKEAFEWRDKLKGRGCDVVLLPIVEKL